MAKKIFKSLLLFIVFTIMCTSFCFADSADIDVRIRVRRPRKFDEQVDLKGYESINVYNILTSEEVPIVTFSGNIDVLLDTFYNNKYLMQQGYDSNTIIGPYHLKLTDYIYNDYNSAKQNADNLTSSYGVNFYPFYDGNIFTIYCGNFINDAAPLETQNRLLNQGINCQVVNGLNKNISVYDGSNTLVLMYSSNPNIYFSSFNNELMCNAIKVDNNTYRGMLSFTTDVNKLISINRVELEQYLYGVVPNEVSASWHVEAIKAQAVAARTYAVANIGPKSDAYDMEDNQNSQVYGGYGSEKEKSTQAVNETKGLMIYYDNRLISAFYHSTSGGKTENSENIWVASIPYLKAVDDPYSNVSPYTEWQKVATKGYILSKVKEINANISEVYNVEITKMSENNRVLECIISTDVEDIILKKEKVRAVLGYDFLPSSWFTISSDCGVYLISENSFKYNGDTNSSGDDLIINEDDIDNSEEVNTNSNSNPDNQSVSLTNKYFISSSGTSMQNSSQLNAISSSGVSIIATTTPTEFYFNGRGWGHGVGMSQYGAKQMAEEGFTYDQILKHYYTGVEIK